MDPRSLKRKFVRNVVILVMIFAGLGVTTSVGLASALAADPNEPAPPAAAGLSAQPASQWDVTLPIVIAVGVGCLGGGYAVARVGAAALGAASERPELLGRSLIFVALAEGIAIYGLLVAILLYARLVKHY
jgi:V/A-type H+-transporting ATPase subunit K